MLLFRSEENIAAWCQTRQMPQGAVLTLEQVWRLSQRWYGDRLSPAYAGRSTDQVEAVFQAVGLAGDFWRLTTNN